MSSKIIDFCLILLIFIYTLIVFINLGIEDYIKDDSTNLILVNISKILLYTELGILTLFSFEIILKIYAIGFKVFFINFKIIKKAI